MLTAIVLPTGGSSAA